MADEQQLRFDLEELKHLESIAKRPRILSLLSSEIRNLDAKLSQVSAAAAAAQATVTAQKSSAPAAAATLLKYVTVSSFSWNQDAEKIKIYLSLECVDEDKVEITFTPTSLDIKFHDIQGKNYRYAITKLNKEIVPEKCKVVVKPAKVILTLLKASKGNWLDLHFMEDKLKPSMMNKDKDPMAGIMDLMKNMYEEGNDEMKKTIAKAWTDARSGKTADPLKG